MMSISHFDTSTIEPVLWLLLLELSVLLLLGIIIQCALARIAAARHTVLLWSLIAAGCCPLFLLAAHFLPNHLAVVVPSSFIPAVFQPARPPHTAQSPIIVAAGSAQAPLSQNVATQTSNAIVATALLALWTLGTLVQLIRLAWGIHIVRLIRTTARHASHELIAVRAQLYTNFGPNVPEILLSEHLSMPVAIGFFRPIIIMPSSMLDSLDVESLLFVLSHECAHVLRRDSLTGFYQRILTALYWFHPLVYVSNGLLNIAREELCDNYVLRATTPTKYADTLLSVARWATAGRDQYLAPTLFNSVPELERRVMKLLQKRRIVMTRLNRAVATCIAAVFILLGLLLGSLGIASTSVAATSATTNGGSEFPYVVHFEQGATKFADGDKITITEVHGTAETFIPGNIYWVKGTYTLASHDKAMLAAYTTAREAKDGVSSPFTVQQTRIDKGDGTFTLFLPMNCSGWPHVSFYPADKGNGFGGNYFGTGDSVLKHWWGE